MYIQPWDDHRVREGGLPIKICCEIGIIQSDDELLEVFLLVALDVGPGLGSSRGQDFVPLSGSALLDLALDLLEGFSLGVLLAQDAESAEPVDGLVLDKVLLVVVGQAEAGGAVSSEGSLEAEEDNVFELPVVLVGDEFLEVLLGDVGLSLVVDVQEQFLPGEHLVHPQPSGLDCDSHKNNNYFK